MLSTTSGGPPCGADGVHAEPYTARPTVMFRSGVEDPALRGCLNSAINVSTRNAECLPLSLCRWLPGWIPRGGMQTLALMCMLLTVGTIIVPRGDRGVDGLVATIAKRAQERAAHQSSAFIARLKGTRHCRPIADSSTVQRVSFSQGFLGGPREVQAL